MPTKEKGKKKKFNFCSTPYVCCPIIFCLNLPSSFLHLHSLSFAHRVTFFFSLIPRVQLQITYSSLTNLTLTLISVPDPIIIIILHPSWLPPLLAKEAFLGPVHSSLNVSSPINLAHSPCLKAKKSVPPATRRASRLSPPSIRWPRSRRLPRPLSTPLSTSGEL